MGLCAKFTVAKKRVTCYRLSVSDEAPSKRRLDRCGAGRPYYCNTIGELPVTASGFARRAFKSHLASMHSCAVGDCIGLAGAR